MAGQGYKVWSAGDVLAASDVMGYLMDQSVGVYASSGARGSAIGTAVSEGMVTYLKDTDTLQTYNGSTWVAVGSPALTASRAVATDGSGALTASTVTATELGYLSGVTSSIQTQINNIGTGALVKITSQSFTASTGVNVNNVFSATYLNYQVRVNWTASANNDLLLRYRASGADNTSSNYYMGGYFSNGVNLNDSGTRHFVGSNESGTPSSLILNFVDPFTSGTKTGLIGLHVGGRSGSYIYGGVSMQGGLNTAAGFDGFTIYPSTGNITGTLTVYGLVN
jgi:hypothetical protein